MNQTPADLPERWGGKAEKIAWTGSVAAAVLASACCWLPLLLLTVGISGAAVSAAFAQYRPLFLGVTFAFLAAAFYFAYRPRRHVADAPASEAGKDACSAVPAESATCCPPAGSAGWTLQKFNRGMLWAVTAVVLAFAFFPNYVGALIGNPSLTSAEAAQGSVVLPIDGMTCEACAVHIQANLAKVPGVTRAVVSYKDKNAVVMAGPGVRREALVEAVEAAGYRVSAPAKN